MKKSVWTNILREIWGGRSRYLSILSIVAIGVGFFGGVRASGPDMRLSSDSYYREKRLMDFRLVSTAGFSDADIAALQAVEGLEVAPSYFTDCIETVDGVDRAVRVCSVEDTQQVNQLELLDGRLPQAANECLADGGGMHSAASLGSVVTLQGDRGADLGEVLQNTQYTVVGLYESPLYVDATARGSTTVGDGSLSEVLLIPAENFLQGVYTQVYLRAADLQPLAAYTEDYDARRDAWADRLEQLADQRTPARLRELIEEYSTAIADAQRQLADGRAELDDAQRQLDDARAELDDAARQLAEGEAELADGRHQLDDGWRQLAEGQQQLIDQINGAWAQYDAGLAEYQSGKAQLDAQIDALAALLRQLDTDAALQQLRDRLDSIDWDAADPQQVKDAIDALPALSEEQRQRLKDAVDAADPEQLRQAVDQALDEMQAQTPDMDAVADRVLQLKDDSDPAANLEMLAQVETLLEEYSALLPAQQLEQLRQLLDGYRQLMQGRLQLNESFHTIASAQAAGQRAIDDNRQTLEEKEADWQAGRAELDDARRQYEEGLAEYEEARAKADKEMPDAEQKLRDGEAELADARRQLAELSEPDWYIFDRDDNPGYTEYGENAERIDNIARLFPVLFLLVAGLVSLTTMSRMVEEQRTQVGTFKALGYTDGAVVTKYMLYALSATLFGSVLGLLIGFQLFPTIIVRAYGMMYRIPRVCTPFHWRLALGTIAVALVCIALTVLGSCRGTARQQPATLMRPKAPPQGKTILLERIPFFWRRLDFSRKVSARNIFRYKKRMLMALIGISGCTALVLTGFGIKDSISNIVANQFDRIWRYQALAALDEDDPTAADRAQAVLAAADPAAQSLQTLQKSYTATGEEGHCEATVLVPQQPEAFADFISMQDRRSGQPVSLPPQGAVITEKMATLLGVRVGDTLSLRNDSGQQVQLPVAAITENYVSHYVYITPQQYQEAFGQAPSWNTLLCRYGPLDEAAERRLSTALLGEDGVQYVSLLSTTGAGFANILGVLNLVVVVLIISAGALAFVVLYNLTNINITERIREIATLKVLGFNDAEVSAYIFRETLVLTLLGALCGLVLGRGMAMSVITTAEVDLVMFGREISALSYLWAFLITMAFSVIVSVFMHRNLRRINMVESLKSVE